jgi:hypothetical protein
MRKPTQFVEILSLKSTITNIEAVRNLEIMSENFRLDNLC